MQRKPPPTGNHTVNSSGQLFTIRATMATHTHSCHLMRLLFAILLASVLTACNPHQRGFESPIDLPESYGLQAKTESQAPSVPDRWWLVFGDTQLEELQVEALSSNMNLAAFRDRLDAARAVLARSKSAQYPSVDYALFAEETRERSNDWDAENRVGATVIGSYEIDLWGAIESDVRSAQLDTLTSIAQLEAAAISLTASVASTWYALVEQRSQARVLEEQITTNEKVLKVVEARFAKGTVRASDVLRQQRLLESTKEQRATVRANIRVLEHALLVLAGRSPTENLAQDLATLPSLPPMPQIGVPAEMINRRPDLRAGVFAIQAADEQVAIAVADKYPSVSISLDASTLESQVSNLFDDWASTLSIDVLGPLFDAGERDAEVQRRLAIKSERVNAYAQNVLEALREVLDAVAREESRDEQIRRINRQLELAQQTTERLNREYLNGDISYIDVLDALTTEQQLQRDLLSVQSARIADRIGLYQALAGGWEDHALYVDTDEVPESPGEMRE